MQRSILRFYVHEDQWYQPQHILLWEWLLEQANKMGIRAGSASRPMAGFGRHHAVQEELSFESAGTITIEVELVVTKEESEKILDLIRRENCRIFYAQIPADFGVINPDQKDSADTISGQ